MRTIFAYIVPWTLFNQCMYRLWYMYNICFTPIIVYIQFRYYVCSVSCIVYYIRCTFGASVCLPAHTFFVDLFHLFRSCVPYLAPAPSWNTSVSRKAFSLSFPVNKHYSSTTVGTARNICILLRFASVQSSTTATESNELTRDLARVWWQIHTTDHCGTFSFFSHHH